jgi:dolichol kinase
MIAVFLGCLLTAAGLAAAETLARWRRLSEFTARKLLHVTASLVVAGGGVWLGQDAFIWVGLVFCLVMAVSRLAPAGRLATLGRLRRSSWGEICFPLGVAGAAWLAPDLKGFLAATLILGWADTAAAVAGQRWPNPRLIPRRRGSASGKTWAGTLACFAVAAILASALVRPPHGIVVAAAAAAVEALSPRGSDNATVPVTVALILRFCG